MCLYKDKTFHPQNRPLIAKEDIVCYKKLRQICSTAYITPYTDTLISIKCIQDKVPFEAQIIFKLKFIWNHIFGFGNLVEDGFIHSFQGSSMYYSRYVTFKCIIPKGTKYFIGREGDYASERIIFLEELK